MKISPIHTFQVGNSFPVESSIYGKFPLVVNHGFVIFRVTGMSSQTSYGFLPMLYPEDENVIRPHEAVILDKVHTKKEEALQESTYSKPVCLLCEHDDAFTDHLKTGFEKGKIIAHIHDEDTLYEYALHDNKQWSKELIHWFSSQNNLVIADGHHRTAAYFSLRAETSQDPGLYSAILSLSQINVRSYHRIFHIQKDQQPEFFNILNLHFDNVEHSANFKENTLIWPELVEDGILMYDQNRWKKLIPSLDKDSIRMGSADLLAMFQDKVLIPFCDQAGNHAYDIGRFVSGSELETKQLKLAPDELLFLFPPVSREFLWRSSGQGEILPAKSTWIEPRIPSGVIEVPNIL